MIRLYEETESTNDLALDAAKRDDAPHGACWVADRQTRGRGSREIGGERRDWYSPAHSNIYMSLLLRPEIDAADATHMTLAAGVGAAEALKARTDVDVWLKWPNDLYVDDRKLAGILTEAHTSDGELKGVVVGLGINVNVPAGDVPEELDDVMTSLLLETDRRWDRLPLLFDLRDGVIDRCEAFGRDGLEAVIAEVQALDRTDGRDVEIQRGKESRTGVARGIDDAGHLRVESDGEELEIQAGDVRFL